MKLSSPLPINIKKSDLELFKTERNNDQKIPKIHQLKNVFVTNNGLILKNGFLNIKCSLNLRAKNDHSFYFEYWRIAFEQFLVCKYGKSIPFLNLKNKTYLIIHSKWLNYSFWLTEYLTRLIRVEKEIGLENLTLIYPEEWDNIKYIVESLEIFNIEKIKIPEGHHLFVENLIFPETRESTASFCPQHIILSRERLLLEAKNRNKNLETPKFIYITRGSEIRRTVINEIEIQQFLSKNGFKIISFENLSFWEQILYMNNAEIVIANHGAGIANIMFMAQNKIILEFLEKDFANYANPFPHWKLANSLNIKYAYQLCRSNETKDIPYTCLKKSNKTIRMDLVNRNIIVNLKKLEENLKLLMLINTN